MDMVQPSRPPYCSTDRPIDRATDQPNKKLTDQLTDPDWLADLLDDRPAD